jgi:hypothetical protein
VTVHSALPAALTAAVDQVLGPAGVRHVAQEERDAVEAGARAASDPSALALIGPLHSAAVAAELVKDALAREARDRAAVLAALRESGRFDEYGDSLEPAVWLWRADQRWRLEPHEAI